MNTAFSSRTYSGGYYCCTSPLATGTYRIISAQLGAGPSCAWLHKMDTTVVVLLIVVLVVVAVSVVLETRKGRVFVGVLASYVSLES